MTKINLTKDWLKNNANKISKIVHPKYGKGFVRWVTNEQIDFMVEQDDGSFTYHIVTFNYIIENKDDFTICLEEKYHC